MSHACDTSSQSAFRIKLIVFIQKTNNKEQVVCLQKSKFLVTTKSLCNCVFQFVNKVVVLLGFRRKTLPRLLRKRRSHKRAIRSR